MQQAQDTFTVTLESGAEMTVSKGELLPDDHYVVGLDAGRGVLFKPYDPGENPKPVKVARGAKGGG